jgi:hypothetical protein
MLLLVLACHAPDPAGDGAPTHVTWADDVTLDADYTVPPGNTLTIEPGVTVTAGLGVRLIVEGTLDARGEAESPITFTGDPEARWGGVLFANTAADATFEGVDEWAGGSIVASATVANATRGMEIDGVSPYLEGVSFLDNEIPATIETIGGAALLVENGAAPRIRGCTFQGNVANTFAFGGALYVDHADPILQGDTFTGNTGSYGGAIATDWMASPIVGSVFSENESQSDGGAISLVSSVGPLLGVQVTDNHAKADGGGVHVCVDCDPHAVPTIADSVVTGNVSDGDDGDAGGVGAAFLTDIRDSELWGNLRGDQASDFSWFNLASEAWPTWVAEPDLGDVYWGTTDPAAIDATIFDGADDDRYATVALAEPRASSGAAPVPRVVLATRRLLYEDAGDEIPVFLTVYNPGPATTAALALTRGGALYTDALGYPGAVADGDGWTLDLPEDSVWFGAIASGTYDGAATDDVTWTATLSAEGAAPDTSTARYLTAPATR